MYAYVYGYIKRYRYIYIYIHKYTIIYSLNYSYVNIFIDTAIHKILIYIYIYTKIYLQMKLEVLNDKQIPVKYTGGRMYSPWGIHSCIDTKYEWNSHDCNNANNIEQILKYIGEEDFVQTHIYHKPIYENASGPKTIAIWIHKEIDNINKDNIEDPYIKIEEKIPDIDKYTHTFDSMTQETYNNTPNMFRVKPEPQLFTMQYRNRETIIPINTSRTIGNYIHIKFINGYGNENINIGKLKFIGYTGTTFDKKILYPGNEKNNITTTTGSNSSSNNNGFNWNTLFTEALDKQKKKDIKSLIPQIDEKDEKELIEQKQIPNIIEFTKVNYLNDDLLPFLYGGSYCIFLSCIPIWKYIEYCIKNNISLSEYARNTLQGIELDTVIAYDAFIKSINNCTIKNRQEIVYIYADITCNKSILLLQLKNLRIPYNYIDDKINQLLSTYTQKMYMIGYISQDNNKYLLYEQNINEQLHEQSTKQYVNKKILKQIQDERDKLLYDIQIFQLSIRNTKLKSLHKHYASEIVEQNSIWLKYPHILYLTYDNYLKIFFKDLTPIVVFYNSGKYGKKYSQLLIEQSRLIYNKQPNIKLRFGTYNIERNENFSKYMKDGQIGLYIFHKDCTTTNDSNDYTNIIKRDKAEINICNIKDSNEEYIEYIWGKYKMIEYQYPQLDIEDMMEENDDINCIDYDDIYENEEPTDDINYILNNKLQIGLPNIYDIINFLIQHDIKQNINEYKEDIELLLNSQYILDIDKEYKKLHNELYFQDIGKNLLYEIKDNSNEGIALNKIENYKIKSLEYINILQYPYGTIDSIEDITSKNTILLFHENMNNINELNKNFKESYEIINKYIDDVKDGRQNLYKCRRILEIALNESKSIDGKEYINKILSIPLNEINEYLNKIQKQIGIYTTNGIIKINKHEQIQKYYNLNKNQIQVDPTNIRSQQKQLQLYQIDIENKIIIKKDIKLHESCIKQTSQESLQNIIQDDKIDINTIKNTNHIVLQYCHTRWDISYDYKDDIINLLNTIRTYNNDFTITFAEQDMESEYFIDISKEYDITEYPTFIIFLDGMEVMTMRYEGTSYLEFDDLSKRLQQKIHELNRDTTLKYVDDIETVETNGTDDDDDDDIDYDNEYDDEDLDYMEDMMYEDDMFVQEEDEDDGYEMMDDCATFSPFNLS